MKKELRNNAGIPSDELFVGCGETRSMSLLSKKMISFRDKYPNVSFNVYSATSDDIQDRIEKGLLDLGLLVEPVDISKYKFMRLPLKERWGVLVRNESILANKEYVTPSDLLGVPIIMVRRNLVKILYL